MIIDNLLSIVGKSSFIKANLCMTGSQFRFSCARRSHCARMEQWLIVGISGVTCSGKTTLADSLYKHFKERRGQELKPGVELNRVELINQDAYFRTVEDPNHQVVEKLRHLNWEIIESIDMDKMIKNIMEILGTKFVLYNTRSNNLSNSLDHGNLFQNHFNLHQHQQKPRLLRDTDELMLDEEETCNFKKIVKHNNVLNILLIEGFLVFNHSVTFDLCNVKFHLHVPYEVCYARRNKRTYDPPDVPCKLLSPIFFCFRLQIFVLLRQATSRWSSGPSTRSTCVNLKTAKRFCFLMETLRLRNVSSLC